ncbi:hypothetical protein SUGI_0092370 [Cryptomeria japonica]|nr:hypothetical protein SUGI_0092370 [Cryptomeria japonica]
MAFNTTSSSEKRAMVNPKNLRFTQPNVKSTFTDPTHPSVRDTACLMQRGQLSPDALGSLHISTDKHGRIWHQEHEVHYKYSYEGHGALKNEYPYEDEGKVEYVHTVFSEDEVQ